MSNRNKKKKTSTAQLFNVSKINWFNLLTLGIGIIALFFSWRANDIANRTADIASQEFKSNIVILDTKNTGYSFESSFKDTFVLACIERLRFANLGNAKDSIIGYDTVVYYQKTKSIFNGYGEAWASYNFSIPPSPTRISYTISNELYSVLNSLEIKVAPDLAFESLSPIDGGSQASGVKPVSFPTEIEGFSSLDLEMGVVYRIPRNINFNLFYEEGQAIFPDNPKDLPPLEFEIIFKLASGLETKTDRFECGYVGQ